MQFLIIPSLSTTLALFLLSFLIHTFLDRRNVEPSSCSMSYMYPDYLQLPSSYIYKWFLLQPPPSKATFPSSKATFPSSKVTFPPSKATFPHSSSEKDSDVSEHMALIQTDFTESQLEFIHYRYHIHLYRERKKDRIISNITADPMEFVSKALPILFLHGNAGSYKQGRSFAALVAQLYPLATSYWGDGILPFDVYLIDFQEEWTAFSSALLIEQATFVNTAVRFLRQRYQTPHVPIVGHSMGGVVARLAVTLPSYDDRSVQHILSMSTPHLTPPLPLESELVNLYHAMNTLWSQLPHPIVLVSISGGFMDRQVPDLLTQIHRLPNAPPTFLSFSSVSVPSVQTSCDHLAIVWCRELLVLLSHVFYGAQAKWLDMDALAQAYKDRLRDVLPESQPRPVAPAPLSFSCSLGFGTQWTWPADSSLWVHHTPLFPWMSYTTTFRVTPDDNADKRATEVCRLGVGARDVLGAHRKWGEVSTTQPLTVLWNIDADTVYLQTDLITITPCQGKHIVMCMEPSPYTFARYSVSSHFVDLLLVYPLAHLLLHFSFQALTVHTVLVPRFLFHLLCIFILYFLPSRLWSTFALPTFFTHVSALGNLLAFPIFLITWCLSAYTTYAYLKIISFWIHSLGWIFYLFLRVFHKLKSKFSSPTS